MDQNNTKLKNKANKVKITILRQQIDHLKQQISLLRQKQTMFLQQKLTKDLEQQVMDILKIKTSAKIRQINAINELQYLEETIAQRQLLYADFDKKFEKKTKKYSKYKKQGRFKNKENILNQKELFDLKKVKNPLFNQC